jgi:signal transduction histidine kinase
VLNDFLTLDKIEKRPFSQQLDTELPSFSSVIIDNLQNNDTNYPTIKYKHSGCKNVIIDREMLGSVFNNLLSNAIKYSPDGCPIEFITKVKNGILTATFKDVGIGIPKNEQQNLFKRYYRAKNTINIQGTGLGLSIVKEHLLKIGGKISFKSESKKGTTFTVKIPVNKVILN